MLILAFGYSTWFWVFGWEIFNTSRQTCSTGWSWIDYLNYQLAFFYTMVYGLLVALVLLCLICLSPAIYREIRNRREARRAEEEQATGVLNGLTKMFFDSSKFQSFTECVICSVEFNAEAQVTPLPCNVNHYFHTACISKWLETNQNCPLCRQAVTVEELERFQTTVHEMLRDKDDSFAADP